MIFTPANGLVLALGCWALALLALLCLWEE